MTSTGSQDGFPTRPLALAVVAGGALAALLILTAKLAVGQPMAYLAPYKRYIMAGELGAFGIIIVEQGALFLRHFFGRRISPDIGSLMSIVCRIAGYAVLISTIVSLFTANTAAALTLGGFLGLVAGFATQTVIGNAVAGVFLAIARPFRVGDNITIGPNSGVVETLGIMHTKLDAGERRILIPSSTIVTSVIVIHKEQADSEKQPGQFQKRKGESSGD